MTNGARRFPGNVSDVGLSTRQSHDSIVAEIDTSDGKPGFGEGNCQWQTGVAESDQTHYRFAPREFLLQPHPRPRHRGWLLQHLDHVAFPRRSIAQRMRFAGQHDNQRPALKPCRSGDTLTKISGNPDGCSAASAAKAECTPIPERSGFYPPCATASKFWLSTLLQDTKRRRDRRLSDAVVITIPSDEPLDTFFDRGRWREANLQLEWPYVGDRVFDVTRLHWQQILVGLAPQCPLQ